MFAVNQTWRRADEYFTIIRQDGNLLYLTGNVPDLNKTDHPEIEVSIEDLKMFLEHELSGFELVQ